MIVQLFVHGVYWRTLDVSCGRRLCVPCERLMPQQFPLEPSRALQRVHFAEFRPVLPLAEFFPIPGTGQALWECTDPHVELIEGRLYFREVPS